jgi:tetratricopeptide (TPR) repeat protein
VHAFLFDSPAQKRALMGASHTFVAKPWRREIYLQHETFPHPVLMHELAHVFAGAFGDPLFGTSRRGATFNVGLIEGVAVAAAFGSAPLTPHELVKVMREAKIEPPIESVLSPHFLGLNASQAYNVAGSFCRFLLDNYGAAPLRTVFRAGGSAESWQAAYGKPFAELASEWRAFINIVLVPDADAQVMRERLRRPSVFHKVCAHELALRKEAARKAIDGNDRTRALAMLESVCRDEPDEPQHLSELLDAAIGAGDRPEEAARIMERLLAHPKVSAPLAARALAARGDLAWRRGDREAAEKDYAEAAARPLDEGNARLLVVKRLAVKEPPGVVAEGLKRFLVQPGARDAALDLLLLSELVRTAPERALLHYLLARQLETRGRYDEAVKELAIAIGDGPAKVSEALPDDRFVRESLRIMGRANFRRGDLAACRATFDRLKKSPGAPGSARLEADDWIARCSETP